MQEAFNPDRTKLIIYINNGDQKLDVYNRNLGNEEKTWEMRIKTWEMRIKRGH